MEKLLIKGPCTLSGKVKISGAKNSVLPILAACLLIEGPVTIENVPYLRDVSTTLELLGYLGAECTLHDKNRITIDASIINTTVAPYDLVKRMRASILVLGPLLARFNKAEVSLPGGCAIGSRPVDLHIEAMKSLGADIEIDNGFIKAEVKSIRLKGCTINFPIITVTGTENALMAAVLADGITTINNAAVEPEVTDLANFLDTMGAKIKGIGTQCLTVTGVNKLKPKQKNYRVMFDRIEAGTFLLAAAATKGDVEVDNVNPDEMTSLLDLLKKVGGELTINNTSIRLNMNGKKPKAISITTAEYPGFATDLQAQLVAMNCIASGRAKVTETVFESRFMHVQELSRLGANIKLDKNNVITAGNSKLNGATIMATDLRASACLVIAALAAKGSTIIERIYHIDRGYERLEEKFNLLGAHIERINN